MKSTLPVREWYGMRSPPDSGMVGFKAKYSKTLAPELIPLTICSKRYRTEITDDMSYFRVTDKKKTQCINNIVPYFVTHLSKENRDTGQ